MAPADPPTVVITGATSGVGAATARRFADAGARLVLVVRDRARAEPILGTLPGSSHSLVVGDLSKISDVRSVAESLEALCPRIDVLFNNAGAVFMRREVTSEGHERTLA